VNNVFEHYTEYAGFELMIAALLFSVQIYCDFAGYSTIAIGAAEVLGFRLMVNFRQPYFASSIREFWHRWHISLSTWFRDYLYIPLGGSRKGKFRTHVNVMITFLVSGLWHGASWNYIIWGGIHGAMQVLGGITKPVRDWAKRVLGVRDQCGSYKLFQKLLTFTVVTVSWVFFRAPGTRAALDIFRRMFTGLDPWIFTDGTLFTLGLDGKDFFVLAIACVLLFAVDILHERNIRIRETLMKQNLAFRWILYYSIIFVLLIFGIYGEAYNASAFIYFQF
jgi:D-alanyl-lipoteichoic acid acyltransferase DltB (MBOAT superfamily)